MASSDSEILVDALKRTRESLEELLARYRQIAEIREPTITRLLAVGAAEIAAGGSGLRDRVLAQRALGFLALG